MPTSASQKSQRGTSLHRRLARRTRRIDWVILFLSLVASAVIVAPSTARQRTEVEEPGQVERRAIEATPERIGILSCVFSTAGK
jgi:hypothetical protein